MNSLLPEATRADAFYRGAFTLLQPQGRGFRAGLDALLLAASVPGDATGRAVDLGAGTGAVGFGVATRARALDVTLVEREPTVAALLRASVALAANASLAPRLAVHEADLLSGGAGLKAADLSNGGFDLVATNPPFFPADHRPSPDAARRLALSADGPDFLNRWVRAAASLVAPKGRLCLIARPDDLAGIAAALQGRLGNLRVLPVFTRPGPARRILVGARQGSRAPLSILPGLALFAEGGAANAVSRAIADGRRQIPLFDERE